MVNLQELIADLNVTIADIETLSAMNPTDNDVKRAAGQVKAARTSLLTAYERPLKGVSGPEVRA